MFTNERPIPSAGGLLFLPLKDYYRFGRRNRTLRLKRRLATALSKVPAGGTIRTSSWYWQYQ